jgi:hypothetical protein
MWGGGSTADNMMVVVFQQLGPALTALTDVSCLEQLRLFQLRKRGDVAIDTRYSSRHWHANEITTVVRDAQAGTLPCVLLVCTWLTMLCFQLVKKVGFWSDSTCSRILHQVHLSTLFGLTRELLALQKVMPQIRPSSS